MPGERQPTQDARQSKAAEAYDDTRTLHQVSIALEKAIATVTGEEVPVGRYGRGRLDVITKNLEQEEPFTRTKKWLEWLYPPESQKRIVERAVREWSNNIRGKGPPYAPKVQREWIAEALRLLEETPKGPQPRGPSGSLARVSQKRIVDPTPPQED